MNYSHTPHNNNLSEKANLIRSFAAEYNLKLPAKGKQHFITHLDEFNLDALKQALLKYSFMTKHDSLPDGVFTFEFTPIDNPRAVTRLWGPKLGQESFESTMRIMYERGADRPATPVIHKEKPFQDTNCITIKVHQGTLITIHSGPQMPHDFNHIQWGTHALAYNVFG